MRVLVAATLAAGSLASVPLLALGPAAAAAPVHDVAVSATAAAGLTTYPAFDAGIDRFAVRTDVAVDTLSVTASSSDPQATISIDGRPATNGSPLVVQGIEPGDEVNVQITDAAGTSNQSWIVLPARFPDVRGSGPRAGLAPGHVLVTLSSFVAPPFSAVLDDRGVPAMVLTQNGSDFKQSASDPDHYSIAVPAEAGGYRIVELDEQYREIGSHRLAGSKATATDFHDSTLFPDGSSLLMGYDYLARDGGVYTDALIQRLDGAGAATWTWNSKDHVEETEGFVDRTAHDYAHVNSLQELDNGDVLASFRNLSQVMRIAGSDHDGFSSGEVIWRLGGVRNDFEFVDDPFGGPCAQHAAQILPNGHLLLFDNGSRRDEGGPIAPQTADMCPDPSNPDGPRVARPQTRVTEYALDTTTTPPTATLVWSHAPGRYAPFAGNAQRLPNGNTFVGWSQAEVQSGAPPVATEVTPDGEEIWSLTGGGHFSYRAFRFPAPDRVPPRAAIASPVDGAVVQQGSDLVADFGCTDAGGSNLDRCTGSVANGASLTGQVGTHQLVVTATDLEGNTSSRTVTWTVTAPDQPTGTPAPTATPTTVPSTPPSTPPTTSRADAMIRKQGGAWKGRGAYSVEEQTVRFRTAPGRTVSALLRVRNSGDVPARMRLTSLASSRWVTGRWYAGTRDVTTQVLSGTYRTPRLGPGESTVLRLVVALRRNASSGPKVLRLAAAAPDSDVDTVRARVLVR